MEVKYPNLFYLNQIIQDKQLNSRLLIGDNFNRYVNSISELTEQQLINENDITLLIQIVSSIGFPAAIELVQYFQWLNKNRDLLQKNQIILVQQLFITIYFQLDPFLNLGYSYCVQSWNQIKQYYYEIFKSSDKLINNELNNFNVQYCQSIEQLQQINQNIISASNLNQKYNNFKLLSDIKEKLVLYQIDNEISQLERDLLELQVKNIDQVQEDIQQKDKIFQKFLRKSQIFDKQTEQQNLLIEEQQQLLPSLLKLSSLNSEDQFEQNVFKICCRPFFVYGERLVDNCNNTCINKKRFLNLKWPFDNDDQIHYQLKRLICSFLNAQGGSFFIGISEQTYIVVGQKLNQQEMDQIVLFFNKICNNFDPQIKLQQNEVKVTFVPVQAPKTNNQQKKWMQNRWVVKILVQQGSELNNLYTFTHEQNNINCFISIPNDCLKISPFMLKEKLLERYKSPNIKIEPHICQEIDQKGYIECLAEEESNLTQCLLVKHLSNQSNNEGNYQQNCIIQQIESDEDNQNQLTQQKTKNSNQISVDSFSNSKSTKPLNCDNGQIQINQQLEQSQPPQIHNEQQQFQGIQQQFQEVHYKHENTCQSQQQIANNSNKQQSNLDNNKLFNLQSLRSYNLTNQEISRQIIGNNFSIVQQLIQEILEQKELYYQDIYILHKLILIVGIPMVYEMENFFQKLQQKEQKQFNQSEVFLINNLLYAIATKVDRYFKLDSNFSPWINIQISIFKIFKNQFKFSQSSYNVWNDFDQLFYNSLKELKELEEQFNQNVCIFSLIEIFQKVKKLQDQIQNQLTNLDATDIEIALINNILKEIHRLKQKIQEIQAIDDQLFNTIIEKQNKTKFTLLNDKNQSPYSQNQIIQQNIFFKQYLSEGQKLQQIQVSTNKASKKSNFQKQSEEKINNICCRTYFVYGEILNQEENDIFEYKNFDYPFDNSDRESIRKQIVAFLNSKGGFLFIGVQDQDCKVIGKLLTKKEKDEMNLSIIQLCSEIDPKIKFENQQIIVSFIPMQNKTKNWMKGRWVPKIQIKVDETTHQIYTIKKSNEIYYQRIYGQCQKFTDIQLKKKIREKLQQNFDNNNMLSIHQCALPDQDGTVECEIIEKMQDIINIDIFSKRSAFRIKQQQNQQLDKQQNPNNIKNKNKENKIHPNDNQNSILFQQLQCISDTSLVITDIPIQKVDKIQNYFQNKIFQNCRYKSQINNYNCLSDVIYTFENVQEFKLVQKKIQLQDKQISLDQSMFFKKIIAAKKEIYPQLICEKYILVIKHVDYKMAEQFKKYLKQYVADIKLEFQLFLTYYSLVLLNFSHEQDIIDCINNLQNDINNMVENYGFQNKLALTYPKQQFYIINYDQDEAVLQKLLIFLKDLLKWEKFMITIQNNNILLKFDSIIDAIISYELIFYCMRQGQMQGFGQFQFGVFKNDKIN